MLSRISEIEYIYLQAMRNLPRQIIEGRSARQLQQYYFFKFCQLINEDSTSIKKKKKKKRGYFPWRENNGGCDISPSVIDLKQSARLMGTVTSTVSPPNTLRYEKTNKTFINKTNTHSRHFSTIKVRIDLFA